VDLDFAVQVNIPADLPPIRDDSPIGAAFADP
jgi:hypothetical protein